MFIIVSSVPLSSLILLSKITGIIMFIYRLELLLLCSNKQLAVKRQLTSMANGLWSSMANGLFDNFSLFQSHLTSHYISYPSFHSSFIVSKRPSFLTFVLIFSLSLSTVSLSLSFILIFSLPFDSALCSLLVTLKSSLISITDDEEIQCSDSSSITFMYCLSSLLLVRKQQL